MENNRIRRHILSAEVAVGGGCEEEKSYEKLLPYYSTGRTRRALRKVSCFRANLMVMSV